MIVAGGGKVRSPLGGIKNKNKIYRFSFKPSVIKEAHYFREFVFFFFFLAEKTVSFISEELLSGRVK